MIARTLARLRNFGQGLWVDTSGVILPYVTIILAVIVGTSVLALDGGRATSLQSQLQKGADALAIAGAAELDRLPNSTTRAVAAINNLVTNSSVFGTGGAANVSVSAINFRTVLPADNASLPAPLCSGLGCTPEQSVICAVYRGGRHANHNSNHSSRRIFWWHHHKLDHRGGRCRRRHESDRL